MLSLATATSALWLAWLVGWTLAAQSTARTVARALLASRLTYSVFFWAGGALLFFVRAGGSGGLTMPILPTAPWADWAGLTSTAIGLAYAAWARVHLGRLWSGAVTLKAQHVLVRTGPYALTRHPIYAGLLLALTGTAVIRGTALALTGYGLLILGIWIKIRQEERLLTGHFGDEYRVYRERVPAVMPCLRAKA